MLSVRAYVCARAQWGSSADAQRRGGARRCLLCGSPVSTGAPNYRFGQKQSGDPAPTSPKWPLLASLRSDVSEEKVTWKIRAGNVRLALCLPSSRFKGKTFESWNEY